MNQHTGLNLFNRAVSFCIAALITFSLLGGIDQLAHLPQVAEAWAAQTVATPRA